MRSILWLSALGFGILGLAPIQVVGQESHDVTGIVADSAGTRVEGAMVVALALPDSVLAKFDLTDGDGAFTLRRLTPGDYVLQVTLVGHQTLRQTLSVADGDVDAGTLGIEVLAVEMDPLVVSVDHVPFVNRRDTLDYNALAFETRPNASVEELLARLPGIAFSDALGQAQLPLDFTQSPLSTGPIVSYSTWRFQAWYRDVNGPAGSGFNTSDALLVSFCP